MKLDKTGFVIIDANNQPFWIKEMHGKPRLLKWLENRKMWVTGGKLDESKISAWSESAIPQDHAMVYHKQHIDSTGINPLKF